MFINIFGGTQSLPIFASSITEYEAPSIPGFLLTALPGSFTDRFVQQLIAAISDYQLFISSYSAMG